MALPKTLQNNIALGCHAIVAGEFASFQNPKNRGPAFEWDGFPSMMASRCRSGVFLNTPIPERHKIAAMECAERLGAQIAERLVELMRS